MKKEKPDDGEFEDTALELYFLLCTRIYERMERENSWPWLEKDQ